MSRELWLKVRVEAFEPAGAVIASKIGWHPELGLGRAVCIASGVRKRNNVITSWRVDAFAPLRHDVC